MGKKIIFIAMACLLMVSGCRSAQQASAKLSTKDILILIGGMGYEKQQTVDAGGTVFYPYENGIIPVFVQLQGQNLMWGVPMKVDVQPSSWHFESKNRPEIDTYYFDIRLDNSAPLTGQVTLRDIRGENGEIIIDQPIKFTIKLIRSK